MTRDSEFRRLRARQVGRLMRFHREEFPANGESGQLTQSGLIELMSQIDAAYIGYKHTTVVRWESGATRPTRERLEVFGQALSLSRAEVDGLIDLAGLEARYAFHAEREMQSAAVDAPVPEGSPSRSHEAPPIGVSTEITSFASQALRYCLSRFALPAAAIAGVGYFLQSVGWRADWMLTVYICVVIGLVLLHYFLKLRRSNGVRELLFVSVFALLSTTLIQMHGTRMDTYGFYSLEGMANTPIPFAMALMVNLVIAMAAGLIFDFLYRRQYAAG